MTNQTNQNNAAQAAEPQTVLSFDERERILCQFMGEPINHDREMAIAIESALLSKLRAEGVPVAGMPEYITDNRHHIQYRMGWNNCLSDCRAAMLNAAPVANAPADERAAFEAARQKRDADAPLGRMCLVNNDEYTNAEDQAAWEGWQDRAALASAPVAGEAQDWPTPAQEAEAEKQWDAWAHEMNQCRDASLEQAARICDAEGQEWDSDAVITEKNYAEHCARRIRALKGFAAPQASEAVHNAALELAAGIVGGTCWAGSPMWVSELIAQHIRALKQSQADKDGCLHPRAFRSGDKQGYVCQDCGAFESDYEIHRRQQRAALSATQTEQGEREDG